MDQLVNIIDHNRQMMIDKIQSYDTQMDALNDKLHPDQEEIMFLMGEMQSIENIKDILQNNYNSMLNKYNEEFAAVTALEKQIEIDQTHYSTLLEETRAKILWNDQKIAGLRQMIVAEREGRTTEKNELKRKKKELTVSLDCINEEVTLKKKECDALLEEKNLLVKKITGKVDETEKLNKKRAENLKNGVKIRREMFQESIDELEKKIEQLQLR